MLMEQAVYNRALELDRTRMVMMAVYQSVSSKKTKPTGWKKEEVLHIPILDGNLTKTPEELEAEHKDAQSALERVKARDAKRKQKEQENGI